jgi:hypothetical protein
MGCWIATLIVVVLVATIAVLIGHFVGKAKKTEQALNDLYGEAVAYVPAMDGSIAPERIEAFIRVRQQVFEHCSEFLAQWYEVFRLEDAEQGENTTKGTAAREGRGGLKQVLKLGFEMLRFVDARNRALLAAEMGLGEYQYIYFMAYIEQLRRVDDTKFAGVDDAYPGSRARSEMAQILENQLDELMSANNQTADTSLASGLRNQIAALSGKNGDGHPLPWEDGLPPAIAASLEPYAETLAQYYCEGIAKIELLQKNKGISFRN